MTLEPEALLSHDSRHNPQSIRRAQVIPDPIRREDDDVAVFEGVPGNVRLAGCLAEVFGGAEDGVLGLHARRDFGELVGGVEGVGLDGGAVGDFAGGEEEVGAVAEAVSALGLVHVGLIWGLVLGFVCRTYFAASIFPSPSRMARLTVLPPAIILGLAMMAS